MAECLRFRMPELRHEEHHGPDLDTRLKITRKPNARRKSWGRNWRLNVEADSDAIDVLAENEKYGDEIIVADEDLGDYPEDGRHYSGQGKVLATSIT